MWLSSSIFLVTYLLISARRLRWLPIGRPGAALLGATACVVTGVLTPERALAAVDLRTIVLLFGMMGMGAFLAEDGFFERLGGVLGAGARTGHALVARLVWGGGGLAAVMTNDAVCVFGAPLVLAMVRRYRLGPLPYLLALATAANTGSVATLVGNPQNMLCASLGGLSYRQYSALMLPVAIASLGLNHLLLWWSFRKELEQPLVSVPVEPAVLTRRSGLILGVLAATTLSYLAGADLAWASAAGCSVVAVLDGRNPDPAWRRIDWTVLLFFAGLFVVVAGLESSGVVAWTSRQWRLWEGEGALGWARLSGLLLLGSNLVSNVPFILVIKSAMVELPNQRLGWTLLAMASTFAGNLTLLGSVANIIVAEHAPGMGFWQHLRVGLPLALGTTALGTAWLWLWA
jgi:Na+/H+ antiporter NhaD/arsenite permease-like protein